LGSPNLAIKSILAAWLAAPVPKIKTDQTCAVCYEQRVGRWNTLLTLVNLGETNTVQLSDDGTEDSVGKPTVVEGRLAVLGEGFEDGLLFDGSGVGHGQRIRGVCLGAGKCRGRESGDGCCWG
jgi:hypothetical protein